MKGKAKESSFQSSLIKKLRETFPGCIVLKNDPNYIQGIPDLLVLIGNRWFAFEDKRSPDAPHQPNQDYYISKMNEMSFARFVDPTNAEEIINEIQQTLES